MIWTHLLVFALGCCAGAAVTWTILFTDTEDEEEAGGDE